MRAARGRENGKQSLQELGIISEGIKQTRYVAGSSNGREVITVMSVFVCVSETCVVLGC